MMQIAICDDEEIAGKYICAELKKELRRRSLDWAVHLYTSSQELVNAFTNGMQYDVLFADIDMPELDGIRLGVELREFFSDTVLIYVSNRKDLVFRAFQAQPFRFIRKELFQEALPGLMTEIIDEIHRRAGGKITFPCGNGAVMLRPKDILYVESFKKSQILHTLSKNIEVQSSFQKIMTQLRDYGFVQAHKSFYVNCHYIFSLNRTTLELDDHTIIPIGRSHVQNVRDRFRQYAMKEDPSAFF